MTTKSEGSMKQERKILDHLREAFVEVLEEHDLADEIVSISAKPLSPEEAIGNPEADDYPILKGKERMMEATFRGAKGQAFTDMYGEWSGRIAEVARMGLENNFRRAIFVASLNALMRHLGLIENTIHCRDDGPVRCAERCLEKMSHESPSAHITMIGLQPRILEMLRGCFRVDVVDMDRDNVGKQLFGTTVFGPERTEPLVESADILLVTGTTLVNGTIDKFLNRKAKTIFYGVTIAGAAELLSLRRFCPYAL